MFASNLNRSRILGPESNPFKNLDPYPFNYKWVDLFNTFKINKSISVIQLPPTYLRFSTNTQLYNVKH